jgi:hypothetical protein
MKSKLEDEKRQLLDHWTKRLNRNPDWISNELRQVRRSLDASHGDKDAQKSLGSCLRQLHDKLGFKAKGSLSDGGLCAGATFWTQTFIETKQRRGSKAGQSVHIEHTYPINKLAGEIKNHTFSNYTETLTWLLTHSLVGGVAELVGIEGGVVSGVINLESSGIEASDWRPRHDEQYHEV